jgi:hypothetical protein
MTWRLALSLDTLRAEVNAFAPARSKASDGTIGNEDHQARASRHNPNDLGVVCALDLTHDPAHGCDVHAIADQIRRNPHPELDYVISNRRIAGRDTGWTWHAYGGSNPHVSHAHFGVGVGEDSEPRPPYDSRQSWGVKAVAPAAPAPAKPPTPAKPPAETEKDRIRQFQRLVGADDDGIWGPDTEAAASRNLVGWVEEVDRRSRRTRAQVVALLDGNRNKPLVRWLQQQGCRHRCYPCDAKLLDGLTGPATNHYIVVCLGQTDGIAGPRAYRKAVR